MAVVVVVVVVVVRFAVLATYCVRPMSAASRAGLPLETATRGALESEGETVDTPDIAGRLPTIVDRAAWQAELDRLLAREKAHTREGDAIAAARRRLPMTEVDAQTPLVGAAGEVPLLDVFEGRTQLLTYLHMWHDGKPAEQQCEGCTFFTGHALELSYLHSRDVTYATLCQGPYAESARYRHFMGWKMPCTPSVAQL